MNNAHQRIGVSSVLSTVHPRASRALIADLVRPLCPTQSDKQRRSPRHSRNTLLLLFLDCSAAVDHLQFDGSYGPSLFSRSIEQPDGLSPISAKKLANDFQRSQTTIPRPPYLLKYIEFGFPHRCNIASHILKVRVADLPCVLFAADVISA